MTDPLTMSTCCTPDSPEVMPVLRCAGRWFSEIAPQTTMAETVAAFIRRRFLQAYGAEPHLRIPSLLALTTAQGSLMAAVGVRNASQDTLFLEDYLSVPVETLMPETGTGRSGIAEIAHLAGVEAGVGRSGLDARGNCENHLYLRQYRHAQRGVPVCRPDGGYRSGSAGTT